LDKIFSRSVHNALFTEINKHSFVPDALARMLETQSDDTLFIDVTITFQDGLVRSARYNDLEAMMLTSALIRSIGRMFIVWN